MRLSPLADTGDMISPFEVIAVLRFGEPSLLGLALTLSSAHRLGAVRLVAKVASIRQEDAFAMQALARVNQGGHRAPKKIHPRRQASTKSTIQNPAAGEEDPGRRKKKSGEVFEENPPPKTRFSNRQNHSDFIPLSATVGQSAK